MGAQGGFTFNAKKYSGRGSDHSARTRTRLRRSRGELPGRSATLGTLARRAGSIARRGRADSAGHGPEISHGLESGGKLAGLHEYWFGRGQSASAFFVSARGDPDDPRERSHIIPVTSRTT